VTPSSKKREAGGTVQQDEFRRDPGAAVRQAIDTGRVVITDASGEPVVIISVPLDRLEVIDG
jgi:hypothetical protein